MKQRQRPYVHQINGNVVLATKSQAKKLPPEYKKVEFVKNDQGERVMRIRLANATADISENKPKAAENVNTNAK